MTRQTADDLRAMRDLLAPQGSWCKHVMFKKDEHEKVIARDLIGALFSVCKAITPDGRLHWDSKRIQACNNILLKCLPEGWPVTMWTVAEWQDHPGRSKKQIMQLLHEAIVKAEAFNDNRT